MGGTHRTMASWGLWIISALVELVFSILMSAKHMNLRLLDISALEWIVCG